MKATENHSMELNQQRSESGVSIDVKRIIYRALRFWYIIVLSLMVALAFAFFKTRYATKVYPITASILIKEKEQMAEGRLLYNNPLVSGFRNYLNEIYLIRSYPLIKKTLTELNFGVAFYKEGNVLITESYHSPFNARIIGRSDNSAFESYFKVLNEKQFEIASISEEGQHPEKKVLNFGDTVLLGELSIVFRLDVPYKEIGPEYYERMIFKYTDPELITDDYVSGLEASWAEEGSGVMNLSINGSQPAKEIDFLQGLIAQYQLFDLDKKNMAASRSIEFISDQLNGITDSLRHVERQLERFKDKNVMTDLSSEAQRLYIKLEAIEAQRAELIIRNNYYKYLSEYLKQSQNLDQIILPSSVGISDPIMSSLIQRMVDLQMQLKMNNRRENPVVNETKRRIDEIRRDIVESLKNQQSTEKIRQDYLNGQAKDIESQLSYLPVAERQLVSIQRNYSLLENLYIFLLQKRAEAGISKASTTTDIEVVNPPMLSGSPISPKPVRNYMIALLFGLGLPLVAFVLIELTNTKVQSKEDIEKFTSIPFIGGVGHKSTDSNLEVFNHSKTGIAESFRALRSNLNYFLSKKEKVIIMVTSSISGEGKSFTSINLASVINLSGKRTLLVGADMRRPKIFDDFQLSNERGLSSYLAGIESFEGVVQKTNFTGLDIVSGGPVPPNPAELLLKDTMMNFINEAKENYDYIIIDTPPLAIVTDAYVIAGVADHILFLVRQNYTPKELLKTAQEFYVSGKLGNVSLVLNDIYRSGPGYGYGYGYGYTNGKKGYGYYSQS